MGYNMAERVVKIHGSGKLIETKAEVWGTRRYYSSQSVTLPKAIAQRLGIQTGDVVRVRDENGKIIIEKIANAGDENGGKKSC